MYIIECVQPGHNDDVIIAPNRTAIQQWLNEEYERWFDEAERKQFAATRPDYRDMILDPKKQFIFTVHTATYSIQNYRQGKHARTSL